MSVIQLRPTPPAKRRCVRRKVPLLARLRHQTDILLATRAWCSRTTELRVLVDLAKHSPLQRNGRRSPVWFDGHLFPVRETVLALSVCNPVTRQPLAGVWSL